MSFEEFIKYVEERYRKKMDKLLKENEDLSQEYDAVLSYSKKLKPPLFRKKHPILYAVSGIGITLFIVALTYVFTNKMFLNVPSGFFVIPGSILATLFGITGVGIYKMNKDEKGQDSERYLEYQEEAQYLKSLLKKLAKKQENCMSQIDALEYAVFTEDDLQIAKECYLYLIPSDAKKKKISIDERLLDDLIRTTRLPAIIYMYYRDELEGYSRLSSYDRYMESQSLNLKGKIELIKAKVEEETGRLEISQQLDEAIVSKEQSEASKVPYQRKRRTERYKHDYPQEMPIIDEGEAKGHRR